MDTDNAGKLKEANIISIEKKGPEYTTSSLPLFKLGKHNMLTNKQT